MGHAALPDWNERVRPVFQITDLVPDASGYQDYLYPLQDSPEAAAYVESLNKDRTGRQQELRGRVLPFDLYFYTQEVRAVAAGVAGTPPYPMHRLTVLGDDGTAAFDPRAGLITIVEAYRSQHPVELFDAIAHSAGTAALSSVLDVSDDPRTGGYSTDTGTVWRDERAQYGTLLHEAVATHIAALVRRELRLDDRSPGTHPVLAPYSRIHGYTPADIMAAGLDLINRKAGFGDGWDGLYAALCAYAAAGRTDAARSAVADIITYAAANDTGLTLEVLEMEPAKPGLPVGLLHRIEEAVELDAGKRPSAAIA